MTREEILAIKAGRELDAQVAEVIFGEKIEWNVSLNYPHIRKGSFLTDVEHYSTDISAAWPIAVKMGLALFPLNNKDWACGKASHIYHIDIGQDHYADPNLVICREAPEAICKTALLVKLV